MIKQWIAKKHNLSTHIILTIFTYGIWLIIYIICKNSSQKNSSNTNYYNQNEFNYEKYDAFSQIQNKYKTVLKEHYDNLEKIGMLYTVANNLTLPNSPQMEQVINLCLKDISIAPLFKEYCLEIKKFQTNPTNALPNYESFKKLSIIYEKQKNYDKAIDICRQAIDLGYILDGTTGQMIGRLARLIKKQELLKKQIENKKAENV